MNAALRAVARAALARGWEVSGVRNGYAGLLADSIAPLQARESAASCTAVAPLSAARALPEFVEAAGRAKALRNLAAARIEALVVIGGNGSQTGTASLAREG